MKKTLRKTRITALLFTILAFVSGCEKALMDTDPEKFTNREIFESLWNTVNEKYSYLTYKDIDWDAIRAEYEPKIDERTSSYELYKVLADMLYELRDGHVNLYSGFNYARNWEWYLDSPQNFNYTIVERNYLGRDYWASGGLRNAFLDGKKYGYIYYPSFNSSVSYMGLVLDRFKDTDGIIIDVRGNGGGALDNAHILADYLADTKRLTYVMRYKDGPGHDDLSKAFEHYSKPIGKGFKKPVVILTNRSCYSATSFFVVMAKEFPNVTVLGDLTGGGAGLPIDYLLPCGWQLRLSTTRSTDARGADFELGVEPDERHDMDIGAMGAGVDSMIERAKQIIDSKSGN